MASPENQPAGQREGGCFTSFKVLFWVLILPWFLIIPCGVGACILGVF